MSTQVRLPGMPAPDYARTPAELLAAMRALRQWAALTYRDLEARALERGERLPRNVIPGIMARGGLPRESTLACFVRACVGEEEAVEVWLAARRRIAAATGAAQSLAEQVETWLTSDATPTAMERREAAAQWSFSEGRLAQAVAQSTGDRWIGLHRRRRTIRNRWPWRGRVTTSH